jgi:hypothetical protein
MLAGRHGTSDELTLAGLVVRAAGVAEPPARKRPRCSRLNLFDFDGT